MANIASGIAGAVGNLLGGMFGAIGSAKAARKAKDSQLQTNEELGNLNQEMFNRNYYQDIMARSDTQAALKAQKDLMRENQKQQQRTAAITGATPESMVAAQQGMNDSLSNTISGIQANTSALRDNAYQNYMNQKASLAEQKGQIETDYWNRKGQMWNQLGNYVAQAGNSFAQNYAPKGGE